jgi:hypothetical protein
VRAAELKAGQAVLLPYFDTWQVLAADARPHAGSSKTVALVFDKVPATYRSADEDIKVR